MWGINSVSTNMDTKCIHSDLKDTLYDFFNMTGEEIIADVFHLLNECETIELPYIGDYSAYELISLCLNNSNEQNWDIFKRTLAEEWASLIEMDFEAYDKGMPLGEDYLLISF